MKFLTHFRIPFTKICGSISLDKPYWPFGHYISNRGQRRLLLFLIFIEFEFIWVADDYWVDGVGHYLNGDEFKCHVVNPKYEGMFTIFFPPRVYKGKLYFTDRI